MPITTLSSREFNQDSGKAKRASRKGPVIITDRGKPSHVLLSIEDYEKITAKSESIAEALAMPESAEIEFKPSRLSGEMHRPAKF
jgi:prevent-host-death family protein